MRLYSNHRGIVFRHCHRRLGLCLCGPDFPREDSNGFTISPEELRSHALAHHDENQTVADWKRFLEASPEGCFVAEEDGQVRGTATTISFERRFAWVGMVLVEPEYRSRGIGTRLLERAIEHLDELKVPAIKLDATPQGKPLYEKLEFVSEYEIERWTLRRSADETKGCGSDECETLAPELLEPICEADQEVFGADRSYLLRSLHGDAPEFTAGILKAGQIEGYGFGRRGSFADHLGPWMARDASTASTLLEAFLKHSSREFVVVDYLKSNSIGADLLRSFGFSYSRSLTRMYRGSNDHPGRSELLCAILGPEFG